MAFDDDCERTVVSAGLILSRNHMGDMNTEQRIAQHRAFWGLDSVQRPLVGYCLGGWNQVDQFKSAAAVMGRGQVMPDMLDPEQFLSDYEEILRYSDITGDDLFRTAEPFPPIPWLEAIIGCRVYSSEKHIWSEPCAEIVDDLLDVYYDPDNLWVKKYMQFIDVLTEHFGHRYPIAQTILRGLSDLMVAAIGELKLVYALYDEPGKMALVAERCSQVFVSFVQDQIKRFPKFFGGNVVGQYYIWAPGTCLRLQEDAVALLSPELYRRFIFQHDNNISSMADFSLMHIHTTSLFLLKDFLSIEGLNVIQVSKDIGGPGLEQIIDCLRQIQRAGKCLVVKGAFTSDDITSLRNNLSPRGLCIQAVVNNMEEVEALKQKFEQLGTWRS